MPLFLPPIEFGLTWQLALMNAVKVTALDFHYCCLAAQLPREESSS
jgi:hypothetical protein